MKTRTFRDVSKPLDRLIQHTRQISPAADEASTHSSFAPIGHLAGVLDRRERRVLTACIGRA